MNIIQKSKYISKTSILYVGLILLLLIAVVSATTYEMGVSRKVDDGSNIFAFNNGDTITGQAFCSGYFYVSHKVTPDPDDFIITRGILEYNSGKTNVTARYVNIPAAITSYETIVDITGFNGDDILRLGLSRLGGGYIDNVFTIGSFSYINVSGQTGDTFTFYENSASPNNNSAYDTYIEHSNSTQAGGRNIGGNGRDSVIGTSFNIVYYAEPCVPDTALSSSYTTRINAAEQGGFSLARLPGVDPLIDATDITAGNAYNNAGKPITVGARSAGLQLGASAGNHIPGNDNIGRVIASGVKLTIREPYTNTHARLYDDNHSYRLNNGTPMGSTPVLYDGSNYTTSGSLSSNQRGIDSGTIIVSLDFTAVDLTDFDDAGTACNLTFSGSDLQLTNVGGKSWNNNDLGYQIIINSGTIQSATTAQCGKSNPGYKRETSASISWYATDLADSMIITQDSNSFTRAGSNEINADTYETGYSFNSFSDNLTINNGNLSYFDANNYIFTNVHNFNTQGSITRQTGDNIINARSNYLNGGYVNVGQSTNGDPNTIVTVQPTLGNNAAFDEIEFEIDLSDTRAGVDSGTLTVEIDVYSSSVAEYGFWRNEGSPAANYADVTLNAAQLSSMLTTNGTNSYGRDNYTLTLNLDEIVYTYGIGNPQLLSGSEIHIEINGDDFVGNSSTLYYVLRTTPYPLGPIQTTNGRAFSYVNGNTISTIYVMSGVIKTDLENADITSRTAGMVAGEDGLIDKYYYDNIYGDHHALISSFTYSGGSTVAMVLTAYNGNNGANPIATVTGLVFDASGGPYNTTVTGTIYASGLTERTNFTFTVIATNSYGQTGAITYTITLDPSCTDSPGCIDPINVYAGETLTAAQNATAVRYNYRFAELLGTSSGFVFEDVSSVTGTWEDVALYCAGDASNLTISHASFSGPGTKNYTNSGPENFTGSDLTISGVSSDIKLLYETNGNGQMTIYVVRPLTGEFLYSHCEFTGGVLTGNDGCYLTGNINWTRLSSGDVFTVTGNIEGGWFTGNYAGYITGGSNSTGVSTDFWSTPLVYHGGGKRYYTFTGNTQTGINTSGTVTFTYQNRTGGTNTISYEVYWIDNTIPQITAYFTNTTTTSKDLVLSGTNAGQLANSTTSYLTGDDEYIITSFVNSGSIDPKLNTLGTQTGARYIANTGSQYLMEHTITFYSDWSGYVYFEDRAGNTGAVAVNLTGLGQLTQFTVTAIPAFRNTNNYGTTGHFRLFRQSGANRVSLYNSYLTTGHNKVVINSNGTGEVILTPPSNGDVYLAAYKSDGGLSVGYTGTYSAATTGFDFTDQSQNGLYPSFIYGGQNLMKLGDAHAALPAGFDTITILDLSTILANLTLSSSSTYYRYYDFDLNRTIAAPEIAIIVQFLSPPSANGFIDENNFGLINRTELVGQ